MNEIFVCPMPDTWNKIFMDLLNAWKQNPRGKGPPPTPLILAGWNFSGDFEKNAVWEATKQWANEMNLSYLIPELTDKQSYFVTSMQSYSCPSEYWNYRPREKPAKGEIDIAIKKLKDNWGSIVGPALEEITAPECFTGKKSRRLLVSANFATNPPWGTWSKKSDGEKMKLSFKVTGLPPKKDGANSMWRKGSEFERLKNLRIAADKAMDGRSPAKNLIHLYLRLYAAPENGDLDNFITGICDGLMAAHPRTPIDTELWSSLPELVQPNISICYTDDKLIAKITAERLTSDAHDQHYEVELEW